MPVITRLCWPAKTDRHTKQRLALTDSVESQLLIPVSNAAMRSCAATEQQQHSPEGTESRRWTSSQAPAACSSCMCWGRLPYTLHSWQIEAQPLLAAMSARSHSTSCCACGRRSGSIWVHATNSLRATAGQRAGRAMALALGLGPTCRQATCAHHNDQSAPRTQISHCLLS